MQTLIAKFKPRKKQQTSGKSDLLAFLEETLAQNADCQEEIKRNMLKQALQTYEAEHKQQIKNDKDFQKLVQFFTKLFECRSQSLSLFIHHTS